jgi:hypothetical protein
LGLNGLPPSLIHGRRPSSWRPYSE